MKTINEVRAKLEEIEADERLHYEPAAIQINAPLALIQLELTAQANMLRWILGITHFKRGVKFKAPVVKPPVIQAYDDTDRMPFGKYGPGEGDHRCLQDVPASYLLWLSEKSLSDHRLEAYINKNMPALRKECPDWIPPKNR